MDVGAGGQVTAAKLLPPGATAARARHLRAGRRQELEIAGIEPGASVVLPFSFEGQTTSS